VSKGKSNTLSTCGKPVRGEDAMGEVGEGRHNFVATKRFTTYSHPSKQQKLHGREKRVAASKLGASLVPKDWFRRGGNNR